MDEKDRIRLQIRLVLTVWRHELRRLAEGAPLADERAAMQAELRHRARDVLASASERIHAAGDDATVAAELARARREIDADAG